MTKTKPKKHILGSWWPQSFTKLQALMPFQTQVANRWLTPGALVAKLPPSHHDQFSPWDGARAHGHWSVSRVWHKDTSQETCSSYTLKNKHMDPTNWSSGRDIFSFLRGKIFRFRPLVFVAIKMSVGNPKQLQIFAQVTCHSFRVKSQVEDKQLELPQKFTSITVA